MTTVEQDRAPDEQEALDQFRNEPGPLTEEEAADPTQPIGRPARNKRGATKVEPQTAFGDDVVNVETAEGARLFDQLNAREANKEAAGVFNKADADIKKELARLGYYDGGTHSVHIGPHLVALAKSDGETKNVSFERAPSIRATFSRPTPD